MEVFKYVVIGGGVAGSRACDGIREVDASGTIALVTAEGHLPYQRPPLSKAYLTGAAGLESVYLRNLAYYEEAGVELITKTRVEHVDPLACTVVLDDEREIGYEKLLLATGSRARKLSVPGSDLAGVFTLRTIEDCDAIRQMAQRAKHVLVLGGSFIAAEGAASLSQMGLAVEIAFPEPRLLEKLVPEELSARLESVYAEHGVRIEAGTVADRLEGDDRVQRAVLGDGQVLDTDLVVVGAGVELNSELAQDAGLPVDESGGVLVDSYLRTQDPSIYAVGDIAAWPDEYRDERFRVGHWDVAWRQGLHAGRNMAGQREPYATLPYFRVELFDISFEGWGDLSEWDRIVSRGSLERGSFAYYYFRRGRAVGVVASGRPEEEVVATEQVVARHMDYEDVAIKLRNEAGSLEVLAG